MAITIKDPNGLAPSFADSGSAPAPPTDASAMDFFGPQGGPPPPEESPEEGLQGPPSGGGAMTIRDAYVDAIAQADQMTNEGQDGMDKWETAFNHALKLNKLKAKGIPEQTKGPVQQ